MTVLGIDSRLLVLFENRNTVDWRRLRDGAQEGVNISQLVVRKNLCGVRRHLTGWLPDIFRQCCECQWTRRQSRSDATLRGIAVALVASILCVQLLAIFGVAWRSVVRSRCLSVSCHEKTQKHETANKSLCAFVSVCLCVFRHMFRSLPRLSDNVHQSNFALIHALRSAP